MFWLAIAPSISASNVNGERYENLYDVACADGGRVDSNTHRCPDSGATVDLGNCAISPNLNAGEPKALWVDPDFNSAHPAFH